MDDSLRDGETVEFETEETPKGLSAINVSRSRSGNSVL